MRTTLLTAALLFVASPALAADAPPLPPPPPAAYYYPPPPYYYAPAPPPKPKREWYGWQTLATDGAALMMVYAGSQSRRGGDSSTYYYAALGTYTLGGPIVHFAHGNPGRGVGSLALRSLPAIAIFGETRSLDFGLLALVSIPAAIAIDAAVLAREDEPKYEPAKGFAIAPSASVSKNVALVGVNGRF
jgi:hypothetical protein